MAQKDTNVAVLGDGGWGTTLALVLEANGLKVRLWGAFPDYVEQIRRRRENEKFLPGFHIPERVEPTSDLGEACRDAQVVVLAVPSQYLRGVLRRLRKETEFRRKNYVNVAKGIETRTLMRMSEVVHDELGPVHLSVLSGPTIAREVALKMPSAASVASSNRKLVSAVRRMFTTESFVLYESDDVIGVELGGSIKNVIAISAGIVQGLGYGSNTRAALFARGVAEMARLGRAMGAHRETFMGLSGLGDLATTCLSPHSRNRWLGEEIGKGRPLRQVLGQTEMVVEGVETSRAAVRLARRHRVSMPIVEAVHGILYRRHEPRAAVRGLMKVESHRERD